MVTADTITDERPLESFEFRLLSPDGGELDRSHVEAAHQAVKSVLDTQLKTAGARELLLRELGPDAYERLLKNLAADTIQGLI